LSSQDSLLFYKGRWYIPNDQKLRLKNMVSFHDSKIAGHFGQFKTADQIKTLFYWPKIGADVNEYVRSCLTCQKCKASRYKKYGLLQPLEIPFCPWAAISMDFITGLPESSGFTPVWVIIDRFTKMAHFIPLKTEATIEELAGMFLQRV